MSERVNTFAYVIVSLPDPAKPVVGDQDRTKVRPVKVLLGSADAEREAKEMRRQVFERLAKGFEPDRYIETMMRYRASIRVVPCNLSEPLPEE